MVKIDTLFLEWEVAILPVYFSVRDYNGATTVVW